MADIFDTYKTIAMLGKSGCGKGTQAKFLSKKTGFKIFSVGNRLREIAKEDTLLGKRVKATIDSGDVVPSWLAVHLFKQATLPLSHNEGIIYEGTNRRPPEVHVFHEVMEWMERPYRAVNFIISDEEAIRRLIGRGIALGRKDDNETSIRRRLKWFQEETMQCIEFFRGRGTLVEVNGEQNEQAVFAEMIEKLEASA